MTRSIAALQLTFTAAAALLSPVVCSAQTAPEPATEELVQRLLTARGQHYVQLRRHVFAEGPGSASVVERLRATGQLDPLQESLARILANALSDDSSWRLVDDVLRTLRERGPEEIGKTSAPLVDQAIREIGTPALAGGTEILLARAAEPEFLIGLLHGLPAIPPNANTELCIALRSFISPPSPQDTDTDQALARHALLGLQTTDTSCPGSVEDLALLIENTDDADLGYAAVETLGWIGHRPQDILTIMELAANTEDDCLRRLLASAGNRIFDRMDADASPSTKTDSP